MPHKMNIPIDVEVDTEYHRSLNPPDKRLLAELVERAVIDALQRTNPDEPINSMDVRARIPNHAFQQ